MIARLRRSRLLLVAAVAAPILLLGAAATLVPALRSTAEDEPSAALRIGGHFSLMTADGRAVTDQSFHGRWLLIYFGYTFCPDACPTALTSMSNAVAELGPLGAKVQPVFVTVDPERDTPQIVGEYVKAFDPRFIGLVGTPQQIAAAAREYRVYYAIRQLGGGEYAIDHSSYIYLMDPDGDFVKLLTGDLPGHQLADELRRIVR